MGEEVKQEMKISQNYDFNDDGKDQEQVVNLPPEDETKILDKKTEYVEPTVSTASEIEKQTTIDNQNILGVELEQNKIDIGVEKKT